MTTQALEEIRSLFASEGMRDYLGEPVTLAAHMLQAGALARAAGADDPLVAASLLHDVGHFHGFFSGSDLMSGTDNHHSYTGASWLSTWFGPEVTEPVRLHVAAKRYLCAVEPDYFAKLSAASVYTLSVQGGPMKRDELVAFEASSFAEDAEAVRRWDDMAKDPNASMPQFEDFGALLEHLTRQ